MPPHRLALATIAPAIFILATWLALLSSPAFSHPGKHDRLGGHTEQASGKYHCHAEPCFSLQRQSRQALEEAEREKRPFSRTYRRKDWPHWSDIDRDCQNTRVEVLLAASREPVRHFNNNRCHAIRSGLWTDPYTGLEYRDATKLDIDHRIALAEAHRYGGANWSRQQKEAFANDPLNLVPVEREVNRAKADLPAYQWMPRNLGYWCGYILAREAVAARYALDFPEREKAFNARIKETHCNMKAPDSTR